MDVLMPNKDGVEACREIMESAPETKVVMLTASTEEDAVVEAVAAGATGYSPEGDGPGAPAGGGSGRVPGRASRAR